MNLDPCPTDAPRIDFLEQFVRCYTVPNDAKIAHRRRTRHPRWAEGKAERASRTDRIQHGMEAAQGDVRLAHTRRASTLSRSLSPEGRAIKEIGAPYEGWCLVFDTETTTDMAQRLRFGFYEIHGIDRDARMRLYRQGQLTREVLDTLHEAGVFYNPDALTADEIALIQQYAAGHDLTCLTPDAFVALLYRWLLRRDALIIGHNLPFDLSRLATGWTEAAGQYRGGFTLKLCRCPHGMRCFDHPPIRIKVLGKHKARITLQQSKPLAAATTTNARGASTNATGRSTGRFYAKQRVEGRFVDTATLGRALLGPGDLRLRALGERFKAAVLKWPERPDLDEPLKPEHLDYGRNDVAATWSLYQAERELYRHHGVRTPMWGILSEASLGKAYLQEVGVPPFLRAHPEVPPEAHGYGMVTYYGGRSEVRIRLQPTEVLYCDFKSQYPTVNALLGLQELLLAKTVTVQDATADVRALLATLTLDQLQTPAFWRRLRVLVKIPPQDDLLPVRAEFGPEGRNIGDVFVIGPATWYTLADLLAGRIRTGRAPEVLQALELVPSPEHIETKPWKLFGDARYTIDLSTHDFFTEVINLRTEVKADMQQAKAAGRGAEAAYLDGLQLALKLLANSTSYGVLVEMNADEPVSEPQPVTVYGWRTHETTTPALERPGPYFAGAVGALIPAGGRLLLALAERLAADRGVDYAMCDTDSMAFARPDRMSRVAFHQRVHEIREWFTPLSPYRGTPDHPDKPPIFEDEEENTWPANGGVAEPLYFQGVSAKRYVLYNRLPDGTYRIRKFSSHGVGTWKSREGYVSPAHIPEPCDSVYKLGGERWHYDLWYEAVRAIDGGRLPNVQPVPRDERGVPQYVVPDSDWLNTPAFHQVTITTPRLLRAYRDVPHIRPFSFITVLPALTREEVFWRQRRLEVAASEGTITWQDAERLKAQYNGLVGVSLYSPYAQTAADLHDVRRSDTNELVDGIEYRTLAECLRGYYRHPEWKSGDPRGIGVLPRRQVHVLQHRAIGKESNRQALTAAEETDGVVSGEEAGMDGAQIFDTGNLSELLLRYTATDLVRATGLPRRTIYDLRNGTVQDPQPETVGAICRGIEQLTQVLRTQSAPSPAR